jgi:hypothetical protein
MVKKMDSKEKDWIKRVCDKLFFVEWDRYIHYAEYGSFVIYGWINKDDSFRKDFIVLEFTLKNHNNPSCVYFLGTSSSKYSKDISNILGTVHYECHRAEYFIDFKRVSKSKKLLEDGEEK